MSRPMFRVMAVASLVALAGCHRQADPPGDAPTGLTVTPGDGQVTVSWDQQPGLTYWIFFQAGGSVTPAAPGVPLIFDAVSPRAVAGLVNGTQYAFVMNATNRDSSAGPSTPVVLGVPRLAGATWTQGAPLGNPAQNLNGLAFGTVAVSGFGTARLVAVGNMGTIFAGNYNYTNVSPPGVTAWTQVASTSLPAGFVGNLSAVTFSGTQFVALGTDGSILTSPDGDTWTAAATSVPSGGATMNSIVVGIGAGRVVAVGSGGSIFTSPDLANWTTVAPPTPNELFSVSYLNGIFVATGASGTLLTSADASAWTVVPNLTSSTLRGAAFGTDSAGARYVVAGDAGTILTSSDGTNWSLTTLPSLLDFRSITFGSRFVAVGQGGAAAFSDDGTNWQLPSTGPGPADLNSVIFTPGMYVAVGALGANAVAK